MLASGSYDRKVVVWDANTGEALFTLASHTGSIFSMSFNSDSSKLVTASDDGTLRIWHVSLERGEALTIPYLDGRGGTIAFLPNGQVLAAIEGDALKVWSVASGDILHDFSKK